MRRVTEDLSIRDKIIPRTDGKMEGLEGGLATGEIPENENVQVDIVVDSFLELARVLGCME